MYKLLIENNDRFQTVVPVTHQAITIGRNEGNTVRLPERNISREHAKITLEGNTVFFEEVNARYGSEKNGRRVRKKEKFTTNDVFEIGDYCLRLEREPVKVVNPHEFDDVPTRVTQRGDLSDHPARLVVTSSNFAGQEFNLVYAKCIIGRDESCDIVIEHRSVSARHACIEHKEDKFTITDLQSSNGTAINGQLRPFHRLISGDIIDLGQVTLRFIGPGEAFTFVIPEAPTIKERKMRRSTAIFGLIFAALVLVISIGSIVFFFGSSKHQDQAAQTAISQSLSDAIESLDDDASDQQKVDEALKRARSQYDDTDMEGAIATLTTAKTNLRPTATQRAAIEDLLDSARLELEPSRVIGNMLKNIGKNEWIDALDDLETIETTSASPAIDSYIARNQLRAKVIEKAIEQAKNGTPEDRGRVEMLLSSIDPDNPAIDKLIAIDEEPSEKTKDRGRPSRRRSSASRSKGKNDSGRISMDDVPPRNSPEYQEYISQLTSSAMRYLFKGEFSKSIRTCKTVFRIERNNRRCLSIMGLNYEKTGDTQRACKYFKSAGVKEKLRKLNCR